MTSMIISWSQAGCSVFWMEETMEIPVVDFYCRYLGGFFLTVKCLRFLDLGKKRFSVCLNWQTRSVQHWNWACRDNASFVKCGMQKRSNHLISSADEKQVGTQPVNTCWWIWNGTKPQVYSILALTAQRWEAYTRRCKRVKRKWWERGDAGLKKYFQKLDKTSVSAQ